MRAHQDQYIHEITAEKIFSILQHAAWQTDQQSISSATTNDNDLVEPNKEWLELTENTAGVNAFADIKFDAHVKRMLDVGGGQFDSNRHYMRRAKQVDLLVWDPYNRAHEHNTRIQKEVTASKVDAVTSMSVLNVIPEIEARLAHITTLKAALTLNGKAYFKIWPGEGRLRGTYLPAASAVEFQANAYANRFLREIEMVFGLGNVKLDATVPNLIVAVKLSENPPSISDIIRMQSVSTRELIPLKRVQDNSIKQLYANTNIRKIFVTDFTFFKKMEKTHLEQNRHQDANLQREYDKLHGLTIY